MAPYLQPQGTCSVDTRGAASRRGWRAHTSLRAGEPSLAPSAARAAARVRQPSRSGPRGRSAYLVAARGRGAACDRTPPLLARPTRARPLVLHSHAYTSCATLQHAFPALGKPATAAAQVWPLGGRCRGGLAHRPHTGRLGRTGGGAGRGRAWGGGGPGAGAGADQRRRGGPA